MTNLNGEPAYVGRFCGSNQYEITPEVIEFYCNALDDHHPGYTNYAPPLLHHSSVTNSSETGISRTFLETSMANKIGNSSRRSQHKVASVRSPQSLTDTTSAGETMSSTRQISSTKQTVASSYVDARINPSCPSQQRVNSRQRGVCSRRRHRQTKKSPRALSYGHRFRPGLLS